MSSLEVFLIVLALCAVGFVISKYLESRRTIAVKATAENLDFTYCESPRHYVHGSVWQSLLFSKGRNCRLKNVIQGNLDDYLVSIGDYQYTVGSGKNRRTVHQTVAIVEVQNSYLPQFILKPENVFHKIGSVFGYQDIDFASHPGFSRAYCLQGQNEVAIRERFSTDVLTFFEEHRQFWVESTRSALMVYKQGRSFHPKDWNKLINSACRVAKQF